MLLKNNLSVFFGIFLVSMILVPNVSAQEVTIPDWIKNNAGWWAGGLIDDNSFVSGLQWLISNGIIMLESEVNNQDPDEEGRLAGGILTGENCNTEIDKDGDKVPDNLDAEGPINWSHCTIEGRDLSNRDLSGANLSGANLYGVSLITQIFLEQIFHTPYYTRQAWQIRFSLELICLTPICVGQRIQL